MKLCKKNLFVAVLAFVAFAMAFAGFMGIKTAKADDAKSLDQINFVMEDVQVRLDGKNGMRFVGAMSSEDFAGINNYYDSLEYGLFFMPATYAEKLGAISEETVFGKDNIYIFGDEYKDTPVVDGKYRILHTLTAETETDNGYKFYGSIHGFLPENIATDYTACAYVKAVKGDATEYKFAADQQAISMLEVAYKSLPLYNEGDDGYDALAGYETAYVDWYTQENGVAPQGSYTVKYVAGSEVISTDATVNTAKLIEEVSVEVKAPRGYLLADGQENVVSGKVQVNNLELIVNVEAKPVIDITEQSIGGTIGILGRTCNLTHQKLELPVDIGGLQTASDSVVIHLNDTGWNAPVWASYDAEKQAITGIPTSAVKGFMDNCTGGKTVKDITIEGKTAFYKAKVELFGYNYPLIAVETAEDFVNNFTTTFFDDRERGGREYSYNSYVLYNDIVLDNNSRNVTYSVSEHNRYDGTIDGRGHKLENIKVNDVWWGIVNYKFAGVIKNIALVNVYNAGGNGLIASVIDGGTLENVYISGYSSRESISSNITSNGITVKNVVYNFDDGYGTAGSTQHGYPGEVGSEYITEENVYIAFNNANFFTDNEGASFGNFKVENGGLYFCGRLICGN